MADGSQVKIKPEKQTECGQISIQNLTNFCGSLEATLDSRNDCHLFPEFDQNKSFGELFPLNNCRFGKKTFQQNLNTEDYALLERLFNE